MSDMPDRIFVDAEGKDTDWFTINHLREVNPDDVVIRYAWTEEYIRADKYAELEERIALYQKWRDTADKAYDKLEAQQQPLVEALRQIASLGHGSHHGKGYTLANIAEEALAKAEKDDG